MSLTVRFVNAAEAAGIGLVNHVVPHEELRYFALEMASNISATSAVTDVLGLYARSEKFSLSAALNLETAVAFGRPLNPNAFAARGRAVTDSGKGRDPQ